VTIARIKLLFVLECSYRLYYCRKANTALSNCTERFSLQKV